MCHHWTAERADEWERLREELLEDAGDEEEEPLEAPTPVADDD